MRFAKHVNVLKLMQTMTLIRDVPSLGGTETTACLPYHTTNRWTLVPERLRLMIDEQLVRFSIGLENVEDIIADVLNAAEHSVS